MQLDTAALTASLIARVEEYTRETIPAEHRKHLGYSLAGHECTRYLWNTFRWLLLEEHEGQHRRLFQRGHKEEQNIIDLLRGAGWQVWDINPDTGTQYRVTHMSGHIGGSIDAIVQAPGVPFPFIGEFKTHSEKSFAVLAGPKVKYNQMRQGVQRSGGVGVLTAKPSHYVQMSSYGAEYKLDYGLYCAVNKDTDELYFEIVKLDHGAGKYATARLESVVGLETPPRKLSETPTYWQCKLCHFNGICHSNEAPEKNCRSCRFAAPAANGEWHCNWHKDNIPSTFIPSGCEQWERIV